MKLSFLLIAGAILCKYISTASITGVIELQRHLCQTSVREVFCENSEQLLTVNIFQNIAPS